MVAPRRRAAAFGQGEHADLGDRVAIGIVQKLVELAGSGLRGVQAAQRPVAKGFAGVGFADRGFAFGHGGAHVEPFGRVGGFVPASGCLGRLLAASGAASARRRRAASLVGCGIVMSV